MSDDLERDKGFRPTRGERPPSRRPRDDDRPRRRRDEGDIPPDTSTGSGVKVVVIVLGIIALLGLCLVGAVIGGGYLLVRTARNSFTAAVASVQQASARVEASNNFKQIGLAVYSYSDDHKGQLPPVAMKTKNGKLGLSWRVAILPYMEQKALYDQFKLDEAWDHPDNMRLAAQMPAAFAPKRGVGGNQTHAKVFVGQHAMFDLTRQRTVSEVRMKDGLSNTIMIVEAAQPVLWIKPDDIPFDPKGTLPPLGMPDHDFFMVVMGDGSVRQIRKTINPEKLKLAIGFDDGQTVNLDE